MQFYWLVLGILCVWRIAHLLSAEDGPWDFVARLREAAGSGFWGRLLDCFYCLSLWVAIPFALGTAEGAKEAICLWLAQSAGAILLERLTQKSQTAGPPLWFEHGGQQDELLREETTKLEK